MNSFFKNNIGLLLCIVSLILLCLLRMPLNLSVVCANDNQGFAFTFGQGFLLWKELACGRGLLYVLTYAGILKIFGFNTIAIIAVHFLETLVLVLIGTLIYLIIKNILKSDFFSGLSVLFWVIIISTPIGLSDLVVEIRSHYNLNEENLCVLFSLCSILFLTLGSYFNLEQSSITTTKEKLSSVLAGIFAVCSLMSKANGAILLIAIVLWFLQLFLFRKHNFKVLQSRIICFLLSVIFTLTLFNIVLYSLQGDLFSTWKDYFFLGRYTGNHLISLKPLLHSVLMFMTRYTFSVSNFIFFLLALLLFTWGLIKGCLAKHEIFWSLIGIWGLGNACVIIAPGEYQPYYYQLIWPSMIIIFILGLHKILSYLKKTNNKLVIYAIAILVFIFFIHRIIVAIPAHYKLFKEFNKESVFNQLQSFQDPVLPYDFKSVDREGVCKAADLINILLPSKNSTFYVFNFNGKGRTGFSPLSYIYAKRYPPTTVDAGLLQVPTIIESKLKVLRTDLIKRPPDMLIISKNIYFEPWQRKLLTPFLGWFSDFVSDNYVFERVFNFTHDIENKTETFLIYKRLSYKPM